ncbi:MAG: hypothetical protein M1528_01700 [Candidatus Marsarchaeota archaeon]|nr:hypothetical protein [Candidatus Marsarchaeota archaeon]
MAKKGWLHRNPAKFARSIEILFGVIWGIDGTFKFIPGVVQAFPNLLLQASSGQPAWLSGWFSFWSHATMSNPAIFVYSVGFLELALAFCLIFGFMRKIGYAGGFVLSLLIWSVPEGFGGPYGPGSTDIGTGIIYAVVFLLLMAISLANKENRASLDYIIGRRFRVWRRLFAF